MTEPEFSWKRSATFTATVVFTPEPGLANLLGCTVTSKVKDFAGVRHPLTCTISNDGLSVVCVAEADATEGWAAGDIYWDVRIVKAGKEILTRTVKFTAEEEITTRDE